jgi:hypothetical protein
MTNRLRILAVVLPTARFVAAAQPEIATVDELNSVAQEVAVETLGVAIPESRSMASRLLAEHLFSHPVTKRFGLVNNTAWQTKWDILAAALADKAKSRNLDGDDLARCLRRLNRGMNEESVFGPAFVQRIIPPNASELEVARIRTEDEEKNRKAKEEFLKNGTAGRFDDRAAFLPVGAFRMPYKGRHCWAVLCVWEFRSSNSRVAKLSHVCVWAIDPISLRIIAFVSCD